VDVHMPGMDGFTLASRIQSDRRFSKTKIIMLIGTARRSAAGRRRKLRVSAYLTKPVKQSELLDAIMNVFIPLPAKAVGSKRRARVRQTTKQVSVAANAGGKPLRILVAEDNPTNQQLMNHLLKARGHSVRLVATGREAIAAAQSRDYDAILMDVQMPSIGGLQATTAIREYERTLGRHTPIIATTAHAMSTDRDDALNAGMDAYLAKPIQAAELYNAIDRLTRAVPDISLDEERLVAGVGGNREMLRALIRIFLKDCPRMLREIRGAIDAADSIALRQAAHALKGAASNFGPNGAAETARQLEMMGREERCPEAGPAYAKLETQVSLLRMSLNKLAK
jgi:two-component system sensor histidine kinase/response regulator